MTFKLNQRGGAEVLKTMSADIVNQVVQQVAAECGPDAEVKLYTTDRAAGSVSVPADQQARDGVLTRAAAAAGLEVRAK